MTLAQLPISSDGISATGDEHIILHNDMKHNSVALKGTHVLTDYRPRSIQDQRLLDEFEKYTIDGKAHIFRPKVAHLIVGQRVLHNLTTTVGREFLAQILCNTFAGTNAYVTHFAIGDDNTAANVADTTLGNEMFRKAVSSALDSNNIANISTFIGASEANFTWEEWGHFIDGTASADTGVMLSHLIQTVAKSAPDTKTVDSTYTLSDA